MTPTTSQIPKTDDELASELFGDNTTPQKVPVHPNSINFRRLEGTNTLLSVATGGSYTDMREILTRLYDSETALIRYQKNQQQPPDKHDDATAWTPRQAYIKEFIPRNRIIGDNASEIKNFLDMPITAWRGPRTNVPEINEQYLFNFEHVLTIIAAMTQNKNAMLTGPTGCGKTTLIEQLAARLQRPYFRIPVDGEMRRREIIGGWLQEATETGSQTAWHDGILTNGLSQPSLIVLDEIDHADSDLIYAAHECLEGKAMRIVEQPQRQLQKHQNCNIFGTANTRGGGDPFGNYAVKSTMSEASRNRFTYFISCNYLSAEQERDLLLIAKPVLPEATATLITSVAAILRNSLKAGDIRTACSTRQTLDIADDLIFRSSLKGKITERDVFESFGRIIVSRAIDDTEESALIGLISLKIAERTPAS